MVPSTTLAIAAQPYTISSAGKPQLKSSSRSLRASACSPAIPCSVPPAAPEMAPALPVSAVRREKQLTFRTRSVPSMFVSWRIKAVLTAESGLRAQIVMPSCWDGKNLDSPNHKSHVAYPSLINNGKCPSSHPKRFITLFYEYLYDIKKFDNEWVSDKHPFVFSNGDPTGYGFHGDFVNGWDIPTLKKAIDTCNSPSGNIEACAVLELYSNSEMDDCIVAPSIAEQTSGWLKKLPGCNPIQSGPNKAVSQPNCAPVTIGPKQKFSTDVTSKGWAYIGCAYDALNDRTLPYRYATPSMTVPKCIDHCNGKGYTFAGLQYGEECWCGNTVAPGKLGAMKCTMPCAGDDTQFCGGPVKLSLYKKVPPKEGYSPGRRAKRLHRI